MPGPWVKDWKTYEALRRKGYNKSKAAKIANAAAAKRKPKTRRPRTSLRFHGASK